MRLQREPEIGPQTAETAETALLAGETKTSSQPTANYADQACRADGVLISISSELRSLNFPDAPRRAAYFSPSWTAFQADRGRHFSVMVDGVSD